MPPIGRKRVGARTPFVNLSCVGMTTERARPSRSVDLSRGFDKGCTANLIVPCFDDAVRRLSLRPLQRRRLVLPISIRPALLAAVPIVIDRGPDAIEILAGATIGDIGSSSTRSSRSCGPKFGFAKSSHNCCNRETKAESRLTIKCHEIVEFDRISQLSATRHPGTSLLRSRGRRWGRGWIWCRGRRGRHGG